MTFKNLGDILFGLKVTKIMDRYFLCASTSIRYCKAWNSIFLKTDYRSGKSCTVIFYILEVDSKKNKDDKGHLCKCEGKIALLKVNGYGEIYSGYVKDVVDSASAMFGS